MKSTNLIIYKTYFYYVIVLLLISKELFSQSGLSAYTGKGSKVNYATTGGKTEVYQWNENRLTTKNIIGGGGGGTNMNAFNNLSVQQRPRDIKNSKTEVWIPPGIDMHLSSGEGTVSFHETISSNACLSVALGNISINKIIGNAELTTGQGEIKVKYIEGHLSIIESTGDVRIDTISGNTDIDMITGNLNIKNAGKKLNIKNNSGNIFINESLGECNIKAGKGNINIDKSTNVRSIETDSGNISIKMIPLKNSQSKISSGSGNIIIYIPEDGNANIEAKIKLASNIGQNISIDEKLEKYKIESDFKSNSIKKDKIKKEIKGNYILGNGSSKIRIETKDSNIEIRKTPKE